MANRKPIDWGQYGACKTVPCRAYAGEPCVDGRCWPSALYRRPVKKTPHPGRPKKSVDSGS